MGLNKKAKAKNLAFGLSVASRIILNNEYTEGQRVRPFSTLSEIQSKFIEM